MRQQRMAIAIPLALRHVDEHALTVDIGHAQMRDLAGPLAGTVGHL